MQTQTKAHAIPKKVKLRVWERDDGRCVLCGRTYHAAPNAHVIARSQGGLGIEENVVTLCDTCHELYDNSDKRRALRVRLERYLKGIYPNWNAARMVYHKYNFEEVTV